MTRQRLAAVGPLVALAVASLFFATQSGRFLTGENLALITQQVMVVGVLALGQSLVILTAGIDLSCGMTMALGGVLISQLATQSGLAPIPAVLLGLGATSTVGAINGLLITRLRLPPFIVTLGTMNIAFALTQLLSRAQTITDLPSALTWLGSPLWIGRTPVAYGVIALGLLYAAAAWILRNTAGGRHIYAVGDQREAARLAGIDTQRVLLAVYLLSGSCAGLAALLSMARTGVGDPQAGQTENLEAITAVVLGGTSLFGGRGAIIGSLIGALIVGVFRNGLTLMGVSSVFQILITGVLVIVAVAVDQWARETP